MNKPFKDLNISESFKYNNIQYTKISPVKISCCKSINAIASEDPKNRIFLQPDQEVEIPE